MLIQHSRPAWYDENLPVQHRNNYMTTTTNTEVHILALLSFLSHLASEPRSRQQIDTNSHWSKQKSKPMPSSSHPSSYMWGGKDKKKQHVHTSWVSVVIRLCFQTCKIQKLLEIKLNDVSCKCCDTVKERLPYLFKPSCLGFFFLC